MQNMTGLILLAVTNRLKVMIVLCKKSKENVFFHVHDINGTSIRPGKVLNIAPGQNQIPTSLTQELDWEALAFVKELPLGTGHFNEERNVQITPSQYIHARL